MREATGNALLVGMVTSMIAIIMIFFVGSLSYSKSYRIKNYIINIIEKNRGWSDSNAQTVNDYLKKVGYNMKSGNVCPSMNDHSCTLLNSNTSGYDYCIYQCKDGGFDFYRVVTYMKFDFPVINNTLKFKVQGETKTFNSFNE